MASDAHAAVPQADGDPGTAPRRTGLNEPWTWEWGAENSISILSTAGSRLRPEVVAGIRSDVFPMTDEERARMERIAWRIVDAVNDTVGEPSGLATVAARCGVAPDELVALLRRLLKEAG